MENVKKIIDKNKIITICRGIYHEDLINLIKALYAGGIRLVEVTFDQRSSDYKETLESIRSLVDNFGDKLAVGAGTVLTVEQVNLAKEAGAKYIISPNTNIAVIKETKRLGLISIPGALSPTEVLEAHDAGADYVKLFPAATMGSKYIKDLMGPISHVKFIATAGITEENIGEFENIGCVGYGISGRLTEKALVESGDFDEFTKRAKDFIAKLK